MAANQADTDKHFAISKERCRLITVAEAHELLATTDEFALDFETTSLHPRDGEIRITSICNDEFHFIIDHRIGGTFKSLLPSLRGKTIWAFTSKFEIKWIDSWCQDDDYKNLVHVRDIDHLAKAKIGGHGSSLAKMCARDLGVILSKDLQNSGWNQDTLSEGQLDYAGFDSHVTWEILKYWETRMTDDEIDNAQFVFGDCVRAAIEMEETGMYLNHEHHETTVALWELKLATFERYLRKFTPTSVIANLGSDMQVGKFMAGVLDQKTMDAWPRTDKTKRMQFEGKYLRSVSRQFGYPFNRWLAALAGYKYYKKYLSTYGDTLLTKAFLSGKITSRFNIAQAITGRSSASAVNLQNIPRKWVVRFAFYAPPEGEDTMCLADYKGVEIRVLAEISGDEQLLHDAIYSDVHAGSAAAIYGLDIEYVLEVLNSNGEGKYANVYGMMKEYRTKAKAFTFQLLYGAGAGALSDILKCTYEEACDAINAWAARYPKAYGYRNIVFDGMTNDNGIIKLYDGRTIFVHKGDRTMPIAANYGVQGVAATVMYRAMYHVHKNFYEAGCDAVMAATVHDEVLCYARRDEAETAMQLQLDGMTQGWLDVFPSSNTDNLIDHAIGDSWAAKP
tara:strand:+ start:4269 stop:6122 length:1854 start_codon:yes stop_codon:yes gene_type:complete